MNCILSDKLKRGFSSLVLCNKRCSGDKGYYCIKCQEAPPTGDCYSLLWPHPLVTLTLALLAMHAHTDLPLQDLHCPNEAEFCCYDILLHLNDGNVLK